MPKLLRSTGVTFTLLSLALFLLSDAEVVHPEVEASSFVAAVLSAPQLQSPPNGTVLPAIGPVTLSWENPPGAIQHQIQVTPFKGDGFGISVIEPLATARTIAAPVLGQGPYVLLPDMGYTWRVRVSDSPTPAVEDDQSWGPWSEEWSFRTAKVTLEGLQAAGPAPGARLTNLNPAVLSWTHPNRAIFYWEVQFSGDPRFDLNPGTATSFVFESVVNGSASDPLNSWTVPAAAVGPCGAYFWRVRPRIQGDGTPMDWGPTWSLTTRGSAPVVDKIAFMHHNDVPNYEDIFLMNADGSGRTRLTTSGGDAPTWSPDGCIAFSGGPGVMMMNADGKGAHPFFDTGFTGVCGPKPAWSPDGSRIAVTASRGERTDIYLVNVADSSATRLTSQNDNQCADPTWSPDSKRIAFSSSPPDAPAPYIYVINADGTNLTRLFPGVGGSIPAWSPDGKKILFRGGGELCPDLCIMNPDGSGLTALPETAGFYEPAWSADGTKILARYTETNGIWIMNPDGSGKTDLSRLKEGEGSDARPAWSPKGATATPPVPTTTPPALSPTATPPARTPTPTPPAATTACSWTGTWSTKLGDLPFGDWVFTQTGNIVTGSPKGTTGNNLRGTVTGNQLSGTLSDGNDVVDVLLTMAAGCNSFIGPTRQGVDVGADWSGVRVPD